MDVQNYTQLAHTLQTVAIASLVFAACVFLPKINYLSHLTRLPSLGDSGKGEKQRQAYLQSAKKMYQDGYKKFTDKVYRLITTDGEEVVVAPKFLPELRKLPDDVLSFAGSIEQLMEVRYTKIIHDDPVVPLAVRADLTPALVRLNPIICQEVDSAIKEEMPQCKEWTAVPMYMKLANIVAKVSGRVFVGPELCHDPEYIQLAVNYTIHLIEAQQRIKKMRPLFRPFLASRLPEIRRLRDGEAKAAKFIEPMIQARKDAQASDPNYQKPDDCLQWIMDRTEAMGRMDSATLLGKRQLGLTFAAIHTTTISTLNMLYSLAVDQEAIQPLRDEVCKALADHDGVLTSRALQQMEKLDSYMKETMRFFPPGMTSFGRKVLKGITLSNGQYLPPGVQIEVPSIAIYSDPSNYGPDVDKFDGLRHYKLRKQGTVTDHARNQFVTTNEANLGFGYGRHACPGRFFAANEIKMILSRLVLEYDFRNVDGEEGERYSNLEVGRQSSPDPRKVLMFKKVDI